MFVAICRASSQQSGLPCVAAHSAVPKDVARRTSRRREAIKSRTMLHICATGYENRQALVLPRIDEEGDDGLFAECLGSLQPVQTFYKYEARAVRPYTDRRL